jgi:hypothetical protein
MGWGISLRKQRLQLKINGNLEETTGNKAVAVGNKAKAISDFDYYNNKFRLHGVHPEGGRYKPFPEFII